MTLPTLEELEKIDSASNQSRKNDALILYKLDQLAVSDQRLHEKIDSHIKATNNAIHGNGTPGLKTHIEVLKTRMHLVGILLLGAYTAIITSYFKIKG